MTLEVKIRDDGKHISIVQYHSDKPGEPNMAVTAGNYHWGIDLHDVNPQELIAALQSEVDRIAQEQEEQILQAIAESDYTSEQENRDRELYYEQKHPEVHKW